MAATTKDTTAKGASLTDRELEILGKAWKCMKTTPEVVSRFIYCFSSPAN